MIIPCFRCGKAIGTPNDSNADYIIASDTVVREPREVLIALKHNAATLAKKAKMEETETVLDEDGISEIVRLKYPDLVIGDSEFGTVEIPQIKDKDNISGLVKVVAEMKEKDIQKTGIICPACYKPTDTVIWGVHKENNG